MSKLVYTLLLGGFLLMSLPLNGQNGSPNSIVNTNAEAQQVMKGQYNPGDYPTSGYPADHFQALCELQQTVAPDTLKRYLEELESFYTRHTYSITTSPDTGIGAARRWVLSKFRQYDKRRDDRLLTGFLRFDWIGGPCEDSARMKNPYAVLPGSDTASKGLIILTAHLDSRCAGLCNDTCRAPGVDDNGSGTALVMELARVMSQYTFKRTIVFMATQGEEQGLFGAYALAEYANQHNLTIRANQNNDIVGGIICGETASPPGCPGQGAIDSTSVRLYSSADVAQRNRSYARFTDIVYREKPKPYAEVPMQINIMNRADRGGRGGDQLALNANGYTAIRFTSTHEHGDGSGGPGYSDRQHTVNDVLGVDTDGDGVRDSFFVDFNYLKRNTVINGAAAAEAANGPAIPEFTVANDAAEGPTVRITGNKAAEYRLAVRTPLTSDTLSGLYRFSDEKIPVPGLKAGNLYYVSVAAVTAEGLMSPLSSEKLKKAPQSTENRSMAPLPYQANCNATGDPSPERASRPEKQVLIGRPYPNPFAKRLQVPVILKKGLAYQEAELLLYDGRGNRVHQKPLGQTLEKGRQVVTLTNPGLSAGSYTLQLWIDDQRQDSRQVVIGE